MLKQKVGKTIDLKRIIKQIKNYRVISFDIFDTLVKRDCADGKKLFDMIELGLASQYSWMNGFSEKRKTAEQRLREKSLREEITLEEIYNELLEDYSMEEIEILYKSEIKYEIELCHVSQYMLKIYNYCISNNKMVILTSDMYLPYEIIEKILSKVGICGYKKLYLSSQLCLTKQTGHLYDYIINDLKISPREIIHLGDNKRSDVLEPLRHGIKSIHIPHIWYSNLVYNSNAIIRKEQISDYRAICSFINNRIQDEIINDEEYFLRVGYEVEGPLLMGFMKWLKREVEKQKIKKIFFLSRDGQIMEKAYRYIFGENEEVKYMYASRRAYIVPTLWMCNTLEDVVSTMFFPRVGSIGSFVKKMGLESSNYTITAKKYGYSMESNHIYKELFEEKSFREFFDEIKKDIYSNSRVEYDILLKYLMQIGFKNKVAIVDIGWHGNMQKALNKICKSAGISVDITGFYLGINPNVDCEKQNIRAYGFLFQKGLNEEYFEMQRTFTAILEMMFTADHGSVKKFVSDGYAIAPILEPFEYEDKEVRKEFETVHNIQKGALNFIRDVIQQPEFLLEWSAATVFQNMVILGNAPNYLASCMLGDIKRLEDEITYIAKPNNIAFYILHPKTLKSDLVVNPWRLGFLKRLCKANLPYFEIYMVIRKGFLLLRKLKIT